MKIYLINYVICCTLLPALRTTIALRLIISMYMMRYYLKDLWDRGRPYKINSNMKSIYSVYLRTDFIEDERIGVLSTGLGVIKNCL